MSTLWNKYEKFKYNKRLHYHPSLFHNLALSNHRRCCWWTTTWSCCLPRPRPSWHRPSWLASCKGVDHWSY